jgi:hypothetical protein
MLFKIALAQLAIAIVLGHNRVVLSKRGDRPVCANGEGPETTITILDIMFNGNQETYEKSLQESFKNMDTDGNGNITTKELGKWGRDRAKLSSGHIFAGISLGQIYRFADENGKIRKENEYSYPLFR